jgi:hypothetical protein
LASAAETSDDAARDIGRAIRARCDTEAGMLRSSGEGSGSRGCGTISTPQSRTSTEKAPQCELCGSGWEEGDVGVWFIDS